MTPLESHLAAIKKRAEDAACRGCFVYGKDLTALLRVIDKLRETQRDLAKMHLAKSFNPIAYIANRDTELLAELTRKDT